MKHGWQIKKLGDVALVGAGNSAPQDEAAFYDGTIPFFRTADAGRVRFGDIAESTDYLNDRGVKGLRRFAPGTILFPKSGASTFLNHRVMLGVEGCVSSHLATIVADEKQVHPRYLLYFLSTTAAQDLVQDHAYPSLNLPTIAGIEVHLPPLSEQHRIVEILDKAFADIAKAKANAEQNLRNARELFESQLNEVFTKKGEGWEEKRLEEVTTRITNGYVGPTRGIYESKGIPYLLARHVRNNELAFDGKTFVTDEFNQRNKKSILKEGDVLLVQSGHIGHSAVVDSKHVGHNCHAMIVISAKPDQFLGPFLSLYFATPAMKVRFQEIRSGSTVPHLTCGEVRQLLIPLPSLLVQQQIIDHMTILRASVDRIERLYRSKLDELEALKKSILHKGFSGEL